METMTDSQRIKLPCTNNFIGQRCSQSVSTFLNVLAIFLACYWFWITAFLLIYCLLTFLIAAEMNGMNPHCKGCLLGSIYTKDFNLNI